MGNKQDYYVILGVSKDVGIKELKSAYRKLSKKHHPDANPNNPDAAVKMREINEAYDVLSDTKKRATYDTHGHNPPPASKKGQAQNTTNDPFANMFNGGMFTEGGFDSVLHSVFGDMGSKKKLIEPINGKDVVKPIQITRSEALSGTQKEISFSYLDICTSCNNGNSNQGGANCNRCGDSGYVREATQTAFGKTTKTIACPACNGKSNRASGACPICSGNGLAKRSKTIVVKIPKGIKNGQSIVCSGIGDIGLHGGTRGNLVVRVSLIN